MRSRPATLGLALVAALAVATAAGCASPDPSPSGSPSPSATVGLGSAPPDATTEPPAGPTPTPSSGGGILPAGWTLCQNPIRGSSIAYPGGWFTSYLRPAEKCSQFHPEEFVIPEAGEYPLTALNATQSTETFATYMSQATDTANVTVVSRTSTTVIGLPAEKFETSDRGEGLYDAGTRFYGYAINRGGRAFVVYAMARPGEPRYAEWKTVVDTAVTTVRFL